MYLFITQKVYKQFGFDLAFYRLKSGTVINFPNAFVKIITLAFYNMLNTSILQNAADFVGLPAKLKTGELQTRHRHVTLQCHRVKWGLSGRLASARISRATKKDAC
jgi:hypothetical protein